MAHGQGQQESFKLRYEDLILIKSAENRLGAGSYGTVYKAFINGLPCAAKILHQDFLDADQLVAGFRRERSLMKRMRHPNIVQYLGVCRDPEDRRSSVLLMELLDINLTEYIESHKLIPYYRQVNISHDITLALSYLHRNQVHHRDLSGKNILLCGSTDIRAKIADFGVVRIRNEVQTNTDEQYTYYTQCPGTLVYMPPESLRDHSLYNDKIDIFSFGVIIIQLLSGKFPEPQGDHGQQPEIDRRNNHISLIKRTHPLLQLAIACLNDSDMERPSAQEICAQLEVLKEEQPYLEDKDGHVNIHVNRLHKLTGDLDQARSELHRVVFDLLLPMGSQNEILQAQNNSLQVQNNSLETQNAALIGELFQEQQEAQQQVQKLQQDLRDSIRERNCLERSVAQLTDHNQQQSHVYQKRLNTINGIERLHLKYVQSENLSLCPIKRLVRGSSNAVVIQNKVYLKADGSNSILTYDLDNTHSHWSYFPLRAPNQFCTLASLNYHLVTIGGLQDKAYSNQITDLTEYINVYPRMKRARACCAALEVKSKLIVAGGRDDEGTLDIVEIMQQNGHGTYSWSQAAGLPSPLRCASLVSCGPIVYIVGGKGTSNLLGNSEFVNKVYYCGFGALVKSCGAPIVHHIGVWSRAADTPTIRSASVSISNQLLVVGGYASKQKLAESNAVYAYDPFTDKWDSKVYTMTSPRSDCFAVALNNDRLMVLGGAFYKLDCNSYVNENVSTLEIACLN